MGARSLQKLLGLSSFTTDQPAPRPPSGRETGRRRTENVVTEGEAGAEQPSAIGAPQSASDRNDRQTSTVVGLRDRALIALLVDTFARGHHRARVSRVGRGGSTVYGLEGGPPELAYPDGENFDYFRHAG